MIKITDLRLDINFQTGGDLKIDVSIFKTSRENEKNEYRICTQYLDIFKDFIRFKNNRFSLSVKKDNMTMVQVCLDGNRNPNAKQLYSGVRKVNLLLFNRYLEYKRESLN